VWGKWYTTAIASNLLQRHGRRNNGEFNSPDSFPGMEVSAVFRRVLHAALWLLFLGLLVFALFLGFGAFTSQTVIAAIATLEESPGHFLYRSQHSLKDQSGNAWQVILFKQIQPDQTALYLRVVGLPGAAEVAHPKALKMMSQPGQVLLAADVFAEEAPAPTVGQYDVQAAIERLSSSGCLLGIPLAGDRDVSLKIPKYVVQEWQQVAAKPAPTN
jgi:hypothetical protein